MSRAICFPKGFFEYDFKELSKTEPHARTRIRLLGMHHLQQGRTYSEVAEYLLVTVGSVKQWMLRVRQHGIEGLREGQRSGRDSKCHGMGDQILSLIEEHQANQLGGRLTLNDIGQLLESKLGLSYANASSIRYVITQLGLSWISSRSKHPKQNLGEQQLYKKLQSSCHQCPACGHCFE